MKTMSENLTCKPPKIL